jgi:hypothetical protein
LAKPEIKEKVSDDNEASCEVDLKREREANSVMMENASTSNAKRLCTKDYGGEESDSLRYISGYIPGM